MARLDLARRTAHDAVRAGVADGGRSRSRPTWRRAVVVEGYASDHGLLSGSVMLIDLATGVTTDPWPGSRDGRAASTGATTSRSGTRAPTGTGNACGRIWLDGRREERWRDDAFIGDAITTPACAITEDAADVWTTHQAHGRRARAGALRSRRRHRGCALTSFNDAHRRGRGLPGRRARSAGRARTAWRSRACLMTPPGAEGPLPLIVCVHGGPTWSWGAYFSDSEPNAVLLASAGYACLLPNPRGSIGRGHAFAQGVIGDGGGIDYRDIMAGVDHCIAEGVADPDRLGHRRAVLRRVHGGLGRGPDRSVRRVGRDVGGVELRVVPSDVGGVVVRPGDPRGRLVRPRRASTRTARRSRTRTGARRPR